MSRRMRIGCLLEFLFPVCETFSIRFFGEHRGKRVDKKGVFGHIRRENTGLNTIVSGVFTVILGFDFQQY